jgi:hypothetical protein
MWDCIVRQSGVSHAPLSTLISQTDQKPLCSRYPLWFSVSKNCIKKTKIINRSHYRWICQALNVGLCCYAIGRMRCAPLNPHFPNRSKTLCSRCPLWFSVSKNGITISKTANRSSTIVSYARTCGRLCMCDVVWRVRRGTTLTLSVDLPGIECGIVLLCNRAHAMCRYNSRSNRVTITKKRQSQQHCLSPNLQKTPSGLSELSGSVVN